MRAAVLTLLVAAPALAEPRLSGDDERAVVTADHAEWTGAAPEAHGDVIEIPLKAGAQSAHTSLDDKIVKRIDVAVEGTPRLIVRLHHSKATTLRTAALMEVMNVDGTVRVAFPREPGHGDVATIAKSEPPAGKATPAPKVEAKAAPKVEAKAEVAPEAKPEAKSDAPAFAPAAIAAPAPAFADEPQQGGSRVWSSLLLLALAAAAAIYAIIRKKRAPLSKSDEPFRVLATRTLGPKSKLFMVEVEDRKLLFTVDDKGTRLVSTLMKTRTAEGAKHEPPADMKAMFEDENIDDIPMRSESPTVAGLLRLRERHGFDHVETGELDERADTDWAEMLLRATNRRGQS